MTLNWISASSRFMSDFLFINNIITIIYTFLYRRKVLNSERFICLFVFVLVIFIAPELQPHSKKNAYIVIDVERMRYNF